MTGVQTCALPISPFRADNRRANSDRRVGIVSRPAIHQLLPTFSPRDAVGNNTLVLRDLLLELGFESNIYSSNIHHELSAAALPMDELDDDDSWLIYHHSIGGSAGDTYEARAGRRVLVYHNITPLELVERWAPEVAAEIMLGRDQTGRYAGLTDVAVADSDYNRYELDALGYERTITIPVMFEPGRLPSKPRTNGRSRGARLLFVGRLAPNKAQHELVAVLALLRATTDPDATLTLVGSRTFASYSDALTGYVDELGLTDAVTIHEGATDEELAAHYATSDIFCCVSDHEGFCVPVIEAMHHGLPVIAFASSAVTGTVGDGGLMLSSKSPDLIAAAVQRVREDNALRDRLVAAGHRRAAAFDLQLSRIAWADLVATFTDSVTTGQ